MFADKRVMESVSAAKKPGKEAWKKMQQQAKRVRCHS